MCVYGGVRLMGVREIKCVWGGGGSLACVESGKEPILD